MGYGYKHDLKFERLEAENARLREALEKIARADGHTETLLVWVQDIARNALKEEMVYIPEAGVTDDKPLRRGPA